MKFRIIVTNFIVVFFSLCVLIIASSLIITNIVNERTNGEIKNYLSILCEIYDGSNKEESAKALTTNNKDIRITFIDKTTGLIIADYGNIDRISTESHLKRPEILSLETPVRRLSDTKGIEMIYIASLDEGVYIRVSLPASSIDTVIDTFNGYAVLVLVIIMTISTIVVVFTNKGMFKPLNAQIKKLGNIVGENREYVGDSIDELSQQIEVVGRLINNEINSLSIEKDKINFIINSIDQGIIILDGNKKVILINRLATDAFNVQEDILSKNYLYLFRENKLVEIVDKVMLDGIEESREIVLNNKTYLMNISLLKNSWSKADNQFGVSIMLIDISKISKVERMKKDFFANASHELKSPLTIIIGYLQMLEQGILDTKDKKEEAVEKSIREAKRMSKIITDMLELSYLESDTSRELLDVDIDKVINEIVTSKASDLSKGNIKLTMDIEPLNLKINPSDAQYLLGNLIENAIKYNKQKGKIHLTLKNKCFVIEDAGIGISQENISRIFERFYRVDKDRSKELGGTGLGLSIVKHICNLYGYQIEIESELNKGTKIKIIFG